MGEYCFYFVEVEGEKAVSSPLEHLKYLCNSTLNKTSISLKESRLYLSAALTILRCAGCQPLWEYLWLC